MLKLVVLSVIIAVVAAQGGGNNLMRLLLMQRLAGGRGGRGGNMLGGMMGMLNNPAYLCRETGDAFRPIMPCRNNVAVCSIISWQKYRMPNLMSCSPMGVGCCLKDYASLMYAKGL